MKKTANKKTAHMQKPRTRLSRIFLLTMLFCLLAATVAFAADGDVSESAVYSTFWSLLPPLVAITLALITKEVYSSLFAGIIVGGLLVANFNPIQTMNVILNDGLIASLADGWNVGILLFLVILGIMVCLINKAGGSAAYGAWAARRIKKRSGAMGATFGLGALIFVDDYFNCLTVGSVMRPVTDTHNISRAKLAYLIDATAAPICMIAPISSWAAAVSGVVEGYNGIELFVKAIPYNFYSLLTIVMLLTLIFLKFDYGPMRKHEKNALDGDIYTVESTKELDKEIDEAISSKGKVLDLVLPVIVLIACCVTCMIYTGGFFDGESFVNAFANCDASVGLAMGSMVALFFTLLLYLPRRILTFHECMNCIPAGFKSMVAPILILTFAWTLKAMTSSLGADVYVAGLVEGSAAGFQALLPAIIFVIALALAFSTGTSWGTFGILIPIIVSVSAVLDPALLIIGISACLAGAVCGDHCSPISDTTIMASAGAKCDHIAHVSTQLPYALTVAAVSFVTFVIAGFSKSVWVSLPIGIVLMIATLIVIKKISGNKAKQEQ